MYFTLKLEKNVEFEDVVVHASILLSPTPPQASVLQWKTPSFFGFSPFFPFLTLFYQQPLIVVYIL